MPNQTGPQTAEEQTNVEEWSGDFGEVEVLMDGKGRFVAWEPKDRDGAREDPEELHGEGIMTEKHGATTEWMRENGESLSSVEEGDMVHVIDHDHASTSINKEYKVTRVPSMEFDFHVAAIGIVEEDTPGPVITIEPGKVSKDAQK